MLGYGSEVVHRFSANCSPDPGPADAADVIILVVNVDFLFAFVL